MENKIQLIGKKKRREEKKEEECKLGHRQQQEVQTGS
jgi:hypothetical protein